MSMAKYSLMYVQKKYNSRVKEFWKTVQRIATKMKLCLEKYRLDKEHKCARIQSSEEFSISEAFPKFHFR